MKLVLEPTPQTLIPYLIEGDIEIDAFFDKCAEYNNSSTMIMLATGLGFGFQKCKEFARLNFNRAENKLVYYEDGKEFRLYDGFMLAPNRDNTTHYGIRIIGNIQLHIVILPAGDKINVDMARVARKDIPMDDRIRSARMVTGHIASSIVLNSIAWGVRLYMLSEAVDLIQGFIDSDDKEDEKKKVSGYLKVLKEEMFVRNSENTRDYLIKDIIFGGMLSQFTDPIYSYFKELKTGEQEYARPSDLVSMLGIYGIPAKAVIQLGEKAENYMVGDEQFVNDRFGIEAADGSKLYIPKENRSESRPSWARNSMAFSLALNSLQVLTSVSSQEFGAVSRRIPAIIKKLEDKKYGAKRKFKIETVEKQFSEISRDGVTYVLNAKQVEFRRKAKEDWLNDWYETIKDADENDKESEQTARERSNKFSADQVIFEYGIEGLKRKE